MTASANMTLSVVAITVSVAPGNAAITTAQSLSLTATTGDSAGVTWSATPSGGTFSAPASNSGTAVTFSATTPGAYTITAKSVTDTSKSAQVSVGVTDLGGVYTYHDDLARDGANVKEYALTPQNVNENTFGKLFSCTVDGAIYAQPLWVANVKINGGAAHNVVYVATAHDSLYALDADASPCQTLWKVNLLDKAHGGSLKQDGTTPDEAAVPAGTTGYLVGFGNGDMAPEVGVTGTPVIDPTAGILYVVSKSVASDNKTFYQRLHAIDITTGNEKTGSPVTINATFPGAGDGATTDTFNAQLQNQRPGLALVNGTVYVAWSSHEDAGHYFGWVIGYTYDGSAFKQASVLNVVPNHTNDPVSGPNGHGAGIWMSGGAPAADSTGNLFLLTGNGPFDASNAAAPNTDYGDSLLKLGPDLKVQGYFAPFDQANDDSQDDDFGAGGAAILADMPGAKYPHLVIGGEERGFLYVLNRDSLGGLGIQSTNPNAIQMITVGSELQQDNGGVIYSTPALWNDTLYIAGGANLPLQSYVYDPNSGLFSLKGQSTNKYGFPGSTPSVSASGANQNGIVWTLDNSQYCTPESPGCGPAVLHAYDASDVSKELWNSSQSTDDAAGYPVKFTVPTVANGRVYVGTRGNNTGGADSTPGPNNSPAVAGELDVYGLK